MKKTIQKRVLPLLIVFMVLLGAFPINAMAAETEPPADSSTSIAMSAGEFEKSSSTPETDGNTSDNFSESLIPEEPVAENTNMDTDKEPVSEPTDEITLEGENDEPLLIDGPAVEILPNGTSRSKRNTTPSPYAVEYLQLHRAEYVRFNMDVAGGLDDRPWYMAEIGGKVAYCLQSWNHATHVGNYETIPYDSLSYDQRHAIGYAMKYGSQDIRDPLYHLATQCIIWEIVEGSLDLNTLVSSYNSSHYQRTIGYTEYNIQARVNYDQILNDMRNHREVPSFTSTVEASMPSHTASGAPGNYTLQLTNTNSKVSLNDFYFAEKHGVTFSKSGETLTINASQDLSGQSFGAYKGATGATESLVYWGSGDDQVRATAGELNPVPAYFRLNTKVTVKYTVNLVKLQAGTDKGLAGAVFEVKHANGVVGSYTTPASGKLEIEVPWAGEYTITETKAPDGHKLDGTNPRKITLTTSNPNGTVTFRNNAFAKLELLKLDAQTGKPMQGVKFKLFAGTKEIGTYTTDANGKVNVGNLDAGQYTVQEVETPAGYKLDNSKHNVTLEWGKTATLTLKNNQLAKLALIKLDSQTGEPIEGVTFKISRDNKDIGSYTTDKKGSINVDGLDAGVYTVVETKPAPGYLADTTPKTVSLEWGKTGTITIKNIRLGSLELLKTCAESGQPLEGITFTIYDMQDNLVGEYVTDENGAITLNHMFVPGTYKIQETATIPDYVLDTEIRTVEIKAGEVTTVEWQNQPERGRIEIEKIAAEDNTLTGEKQGKKLSGAVFEIYDEEGNVVDALTTDENGYAASKPLPLAKYIVKEITPPSVYWLLNDTVFCAELKQHGDVIELECKDYPVRIDTTVEKYGVTEAKSGEVIRYDFKNIENTSNVPLDRFYWHEKLPTDAVRLESIVTGTWNEKLHYNVYYKTNLSDIYHVLSVGLNTEQSYTLDCSPSVLGLHSGEYVTDYRFEFGTVKVGFKEVDAPYIFVKVNDELPNGYQFVNRTDVGGKYHDKWVYDKDAWVTVIKKEEVKLPKTGAYI